MLLGTTANVTTSIITAMTTVTKIRVANLLVKFL
jgi:hypothetical protein